MSRRHPYWSYGVTTVPDREHTTLPLTLASLALAGFNSPRLFVDGATSGFDQFGFETTFRYPRIRSFGNWILALGELYLRNPHAKRYAIFQDDFVAYRNLKLYLELCEMPQKGYWNLYTFPENESRFKQGEFGWKESNQLGRGAVALVFNEEGVTNLLKSDSIIMKPQSKSPRAWKSIDGGVATAMKRCGFKEYVHLPTLVQHIGDTSTMENRQFPKPESFRGETYDALNLIPEKKG